MHPSSGQRSSLASFLAGLAVWLAVASVACAAADSPPAPNYSTDAAWAARPGHEGRALELPPGASPVAEDPQVDVFFVHPTTLLFGGTANASADAAAPESRRVDEVVLRHQASVFSGCCRIWVPRYRQASLAAITSHDARAYAADELAYADVERAFDAFLASIGDRPFLIAGHSQGSIHALRLLQQRVIGTPLQQRLVAAYLAGVALPREIVSLGLPLCDGPERTGCVLSWNSVRSGHDDRRRREDAVIWWQGRYQPVGGRPLACVNPLDGRVDSTVGPEANAGALHGAGRDAPLPRLVPQLTGAACEDGLLGVDIPWQHRREFGDLLTMTGNYHDFDYGLWWANLRADASRRAAAFAAAHAVAEHTAGHVR